MMNLVIIGPSGSGKGTQAKMLAEELNLEHISMGELLRGEAAAGTEAGKQIERFVNEGKWAPAEVTVAVLEKKLAGVKRDFILDGIPRSLEQIELLGEMVARLGRKIDKVIYVFISDDEAVRRLSARVSCPVDGEMYNLLTEPPKDDEKCDKHGVSLVRREDDQPEEIRTRLGEFHRTIVPVLAEYGKQGILVEVNGERPIEEIHKEIMVRLSN